MHRCAPSSSGWLRAAARALSSRASGTAGCDLSGRRALVTGGSSGIGAAVAAALASAGVRVVVTGRDDAALARVAAAIVAAEGGGEAAGVVRLVADLRQPGAADHVVEAAVAALGGLDIVVSNAGSGWAGPMADMTAAEIDDLVDLNLRAPLHLTRAALPHLQSSERGCLVFVGSVAGRLGVAREVAYSATKAGVGGLADALRSELTGTGVHVSLVTPGVVDTAFFERRNRPYERTRPRPIPAAAVADAVVDCIVRGRSEVDVPAWLGLPIRLHGALPRLYRVLAERFG